MKIYSSIGTIFIVNVLTGTLEQFFIVNVGFFKKKKRKKPTNNAFAFLLKRKAKALLVGGFSNHCRSRRGKMLNIIFFRDTGNSFTGSYARND